MLQRYAYLYKLIKLQDTNIIKVITGVRRCGKSTLLELFQTYLLGHGVDEEQIIFVNLEDLANEGLREYHALYDYVCQRMQGDKKYYLFFDEIQMVPEFQNAINSLFLKPNVDIYLTGSNAYMLSSELATLLSGRYIEISMLPYSFKEYMEATGLPKQEAFQQYYSRGGFPYAATIADKQILTDYIEGIYNTVLLKDIVARKKIGDIQLLEAVIKFLLDNIGNVVSTKKIADSLTSAGRKTSPSTIDSYVTALKSAYILYEAQRYDVKGKQYLRSLEKYYVVDMSLRNLLLGEHSRDIGHILENIVYLELLRRGYKVYIGKVGALEVDFVAQNGDDIAYYQVSASVMDTATYEREFAPLRQIRDNYPKYVLTMDSLPMGENGIIQKNIIDFLLE